MVETEELSFNYFTTWKKSLFTRDHHTFDLADFYTITQDAFPNMTYGSFSYYKTV